MKPPNWDRLQDIYHEALAKPESERSAFVEKACSGDPDLLRQIKSLLKASDLSDDILKAPVFNINSAPDDLVGTTIGERYFVEKQMNPGGMSQLYLARAHNLQDQAVVIKVPSRELAQDSYFRQKFKHEVEALLRIKHAGVVGAIDTGELVDGRPYLVMQYVEGDTLQSQITSDGMDLKRVASILKKIGAALSHVHERGIFHRDLKPENIMLESDDSVVLVDFGIAKVKNSVVAPSTVNAVRAGTLPYMSPEHLRGEEITAASDIFSMGVIAYEMITGRKPFKPASPAHMLELQGKGLSKHLPDEVPARAERILRRALKFEPTARYQSASEFADQLANALLEPRKPKINRMRWARVASGLVMALLSLVLYKTCEGPPPPPNHFTYWLKIQRLRDGQGYQEPLKSNGEETFNNGDQFQLNVLTPVTAYLYVMKEDPPSTNDISFRMIFPNQSTNNGSASLGVNQTIQSEWFTFQGSAGDENCWMVWSLTPVPELESAKVEAFKHPGGGLVDPTLTAVKEFLRTKQLENKVTVYHYKKEQEAVPRGRSDILVALAQFKHR